LAQAKDVNIQTVSFREEKSDISRDVANIQLQREKIAALKEKCRDAKIAKNEIAEASTMKELRKEKADLRMYRSYLRADKINLIDDHNTVIDQRKKNIRDNKCQLKESRKQLNRDLKDGNDEAASRTAMAVAQLQKDIDREEELLREQKITKNNDIIAVNEVIRKSDGQYGGILKAESVMAETRIRMEK